MPYKEGKRWRGVVRFTPTHGPIIRRTKFFETKKQAGDWEGETVKALKVADQRNPAKADVIGRALTVTEWANRYLDHVEATMCRKTYNEKLLAFQRLGAFLRDDRSLVGRISLHVVLEHLAMVSRTVTGNSANKDRKNLAAAWVWGIKYLNLDRDNPFQHVDRFPEDRHPRYVPPLGDFRKVVDLAGPRRRQLLLLAFHTAPRRSELWKLKWSEVDFGSGLVGYWTRKRRSGNAEFDELPMSAGLRAKLAEWKLVSGSEDLVFGSRFNGLLDPNNRWLKRLCAEAGVKPFGFHGIRHLAARVAIDNGATIMEVKHLLRHKSIATTQRYILRTKKTTGAVDALDAALADAVRGRARENDTCG
jgi:integrase